MTARVRFFSKLGGFVLFVALLLFSPVTARAAVQCGSVDSLIEAAERGGAKYKWVDGVVLAALADLYFENFGIYPDADRVLVARLRNGFVLAFASGEKSCFGMTVPDSTIEAAVIDGLVFGRPI